MATRENDAPPTEDDTPPTARRNPPGTFGFSPSSTLLLAGVLTVGLVGLALWINYVAQSGGMLGPGGPGPGPIPEPAPPGPVADFTVPDDASSLDSMPAPADG